MDQESKPAKPISRRSRSAFTEKFKAGAIRLVLDEGKTIPQVARDLDDAVRYADVGRAGAGRPVEGQDGPHTAEREELSKLRKLVRELTMERDILKEAAVIFAKHRR